MPPKTSRARTGAAAQRTGPTRTTRSQSRIMSETPSVIDPSPSTQAKSGVGGKRDVRAQPSFAYGSPEKARVPRRQGSEVRQQAVTDVIHGMVQGVHSTTTRRSMQISAAPGKLEDARKEDDRARRSKNQSLLSSEEVDDNQPAPKPEPMLKPMPAPKKVSPRTTRSLPRKQAAADSTMADTTINDQTVSYLAEGWISGPAGVEGDSQLGTLLKVLALVVMLFSAAYITRTTDIATNLSSSLASLKDSLASSAPLPGANETHRFHSLTHDIQGLGARVLRLERAADKPASGPAYAPKPTLLPEDVGRAVNFFAPNSGVQIDPWLTSPTRETPARDAFAPWQLALLPASLLPKPPGPSAAFLPWHDAGDCWCAADSRGRSQLVAVLGRAAQPRELVVEHVPRAETLDPGAAPRGLQLWVQVEDPEVRDRLRLAAMQHVGRAGAAQPGEAGGALDASWVAVAAGEFDFYGADEQRFAVAPALADMGVHVRRVAVRTLGNWADGGADHVCLYRLKLLGSAADINSRVAGN